MKKYIVFGVGPFIVLKMTLIDFSYNRNQPAGGMQDLILYFLLFVIIVLTILGFMYFYLVNNESRFNKYELALLNAAVIFTCVMPILTFGWGDTMEVFFEFLSKKLSSVCMFCTMRYFGRLFWKAFVGIQFIGVILTVITRLRAPKG